PAAMRNNPGFVAAGGVLDGADCFDAQLFGLTARESELMDPQHRVFLECAWESLEDAGVDPSRTRALIGVYAGAGFNGYMATQLMARPDLLESVGPFQAIISSDKDFLATQVAYRLGLK